MRPLRKPFLLLWCASGLLGAQTPAPTQPDSVRFPCRADANIRAFDFWLEHWSVRIRGAEVGINRIEQISDRCGLIENWTSRAGNSGKSLNWFDQHTRKWRQVFLYDHGVADDYTGEWRNGKMVFLTPPVLGPAGRSEQQRMTFTPISRDSLAQLVEVSPDTGRTWSPTFDAIYVRLIPDSVAVHRRATEIIEADNHRDLERVVDSYTADAVLIPPDGPEVLGRQSIRPRYKTLFDEHQPELHTAIDEIVVYGDWAMVRGRTTGAFKPLKGGTARQVSDVYTEILRKDRDGQWRIARLMWHAAPNK